MQTIGVYLANIRRKKGVSISDLEKGTRIKKDFLVALEAEKWEVLPEYPVVMGFVKSVAAYLGEEESKVMALLRRDYPPKALPLNPKPDVSKVFVWSPRLTFFVGVVIVILAVLGYLGFQYYKFVSPPALSLDYPQEDAHLQDKYVVVGGKTDTDAVVTINNQSAVVSPDGLFETEIELSETTSEIKVSAKSRAGKETVIIRKVKVDL